MPLIKLSKDVGIHKIGDIVNYSKNSAKDIVKSDGGYYVKSLDYNEGEKEDLTIPEYDSTLPFIKTLTKDGKITEVRQVGGDYVLEENEKKATKEEFLEYENKTMKEYFKKKLSEKKSIDVDVKDKKIKKKEFVLYTSLIINNKDKMMVEQVYDDENKSRFCIYTDNSEENLSYCTEINLDGIRHLPLFGEEVYKKAIYLPSKTEEYESDEKLEEDIKKFVKKWLDIPDDFLQFAVWNIKRSWVYERFHTLNYLRALGDTGQGKSRFLDVLGYLHYKPIATSGATTPAPVFRIIDKWKGTLIIDEADFQKSDEAQDIIKIINQGYERGRYVMRCDKENKNRVNFFDPFCPKILATRKAFDDKAVESRCITQVMTGTRRKDITWNLDDSFWEDAQTLRNKLLLWRFRNFFKIDPNKKIDFDFGNIEPRVQQIVSSFVKLFGDDKKKLEIFKGFINNYQSDLIDERQNSWAGTIVSGIYSLYKEGNMDISAGDIIERKKITNKEGKLVSSRSISSTLKSLGFSKSQPRNVDGKTKRCVPLEVEHLTTLFERYGYGVTEITSYTDTRKFNNEAQDTLEGGIRIGCNLRNTVIEEETIENNQTPISTGDLNLNDKIIIILDQLLQKTNQKLIGIDVLTTQIKAQHKDFKLETIESTLEELKRKGVLFEPRNGFIGKL